MYVRKIIVAVAALLVCAILLVSVSFAWLSLSRVPEVTGMETRLGANGSLEMALLTRATYMDPSLIRTRVGDSMELGDFLESNTSWGNTVDISQQAYGLDQISLYPARLNVRSGEEGLVYVGNNLLLFPEYSADGRLQTVNPNSVTAAYNGTEFMYSTEEPEYGVRGIGTIPNISLQETALVNARVAVRSYGASAVSAAKSVWKTNGQGIMSLYVRHYIEGNDTYTRADVDRLKSAASKLLTAVNYLELALRQGVIGYAAASVEDAETFQMARDTVENSSIPLSMILDSVGLGVPGTLKDRIEDVEETKTALTLIVRQCDRLRGDTFTWSQIGPLAEGMINPSKAYLNEVKLSALAGKDALGEDNLFSLIPGSGAYATVAEFAGDFTVLFDYNEHTSVEVEVLTDGSETYLEKLAELLDKLHISEDEDREVTAPLEDIYGYVADMAFRCNAEESFLLLQTTPAERAETETGANAADTMGSGSFMRFVSEEMSDEQIIAMMDAVRIGFIDNQNRLLALGKPGVLNATEVEGGMQAPVFLYDFSVSADGGLLVGERKADGATIVELEQSEAMVITVVVWLDGDAVDNRLAGISPKSLSGDMNLQFSSSASLNVARDSD